MQKLIPILAMLNGYAVQNEQVLSVTLSVSENDVIEIKFPAMTFKRLNAPNTKGGYVWALCWNATKEVMCIINPN